MMKRIYPGAEWLGTVSVLLKTLARPRPLSFHMSPISVLSGPPHKKHCGSTTHYLADRLIEKGMSCPNEILALTARREPTMPLTITVTDPLALELQSEANSRKISVEQFALEVLGQAVQREVWATANRRRLTLIRQQFAVGLTATETAELQDLQRQADKHLELLDSQMLDDVSQMETLARKAVNGSTP